VALDTKAVDTFDTAEWWMNTLAQRMLDGRRLTRFGILSAYRSGCPPLLMATQSQREGFYAFQRLSRSNFARPIVRAPAERMRIRSIRTAAADDDNGDTVAWRYFTGNGLQIDSVDVHSDMLTFSESYVRVGLDQDSKPIAVRRDPWYTITAQDPLNPRRTIAAMELVYDEWAGRDYAYLWRPGRQWVAWAPRNARPTRFKVPGTDSGPRRYFSPFWRMSFNPASFTMRPELADVAAGERDGGPYSQSFDQQVVPVVCFANRDGVGEFEEHIDLLDRINHTVSTRVVIAALQAYKLRALTQKDSTVDRLPDIHPVTGEQINWAELLQPGPDALVKLPPGVDLKELNEVTLQPILESVKDDVKHLSAVSSTPFSLFSPDGVNQSAEGAQLNREGLVFKVEDRDAIAAQSWAQVMSLMFMFGDESDRYTGQGDQRVDRADAGRIVIDWTPAERYSLSEKAQADSQNKSLSRDFAAAKIWGLTPDEVEINRQQIAAEALFAAPKPGAPSDQPAA
jgi:hypothetical protein